MPTVCTVIRLADWPEGGYSNSDKDKPEIGMRRGEVLIGRSLVEKAGWQHGIFGGNSDST